MNTEDVKTHTKTLAAACDLVEMIYNYPDPEDLHDECDGDPIALLETIASGLGYPTTGLRSLLRDDWKDSLGDLRARVEEMKALEHHLFMKRLAVRGQEVEAAA